MNKFFASFVPAFVLLGASPAVLPVAYADEPEYETLSSQSAYQLNVVYFLGSDREPIAGYQERLRELLLFGQEFYGMEMQRNGYGFRSFGLNQSAPDKVNILVYRAKNPASAYPYSNGGGSRAAAEVNEWLDAEAGRRKSQHTLIIFPTFYDEQYNDMNPGGVPFYGLGRTCCALDYALFDIKYLGKDTKEGRLMTKWYGGLLHELGHGLNLPHNHESASEAETLGTALMGAGNHTFGQTSTFLTEASCAILDVCEVFATQSYPVFYTGKSAELGFKSIKVSFEPDCIHLQAYYRSNSVSSVICYVEEAPTGANANYEAANFTKPSQPRKVERPEPRISFEMPWAEMPQIKKDDCLIRVRFLMTDGSYEEKTIPFHRKQKEEIILSDSKKANK